MNDKGCLTCSHMQLYAGADEGDDGTRVEYHDAFCRRARWRLDDWSTITRATIHRLHVLTHDCPHYQYVRYLANDERRLTPIKADHALARRDQDITPVY